MINISIWDKKACTPTDLGRHTPSFAVVGQRETDFGRTGFVALLPTTARIAPGDWTVVFGALEKKCARSGTLNLPFFSKVALRAAAECISSMGYQVELRLIEKLQSLFDQVQMAPTIWTARFLSVGMSGVSKSRYDVMAATGANSHGLQLNAELC